MSILDRLTERVGGIFGDFIEEVRISDEVHAMLQRAAGQYDTGQYDEALATLEPISSDPPLARVHHLRGLCHMESGRPQEAARELRRAIELKEQASSHLWAGLAMGQIHEWRAAQDHLLRALALSAEQDPIRARVHAALGEAYLRQRRADKAVKEIRKGMRAFEMDPTASVTLAEALLERDRPEEARAALEHVEVEALARLDAHLVHARVARALGQFEEALEAFQRAVESRGGTDAERAEARLGAARAALELDRVTLAEALIERAEREVTANALGASFYVLRARLNRRLDRMPQAARDYEQALERDPTQGEALLGLGELELAAEQPEQAARHFERALSFDASSPHAVEALLGLGRARHDVGDLTGARQTLEEAARVHRALQTTPYAATPRAGRLGALVALGLARVALSMGDLARGLRDLQEVRGLQREENPLALELEALKARALDGLRPKLNLPGALDEPLSMERALQQLLAFIASDGRLSAFLEPAQCLLTALNSPLSVAIVGEFNAGKSTLLNALIGEDILPTGVLPTTAHTGIIQYGPRQAARVVWRGEEDAVEVSFREAKRLMKDNGEAIDHLQYLSPHPQLRAVHYWDTPGFNALEARHEEVATQALERAEAILWVLDANQVLSQTEFERIERIPAGRERLMVVINKIDRLGAPGERERDVSTLTEYVAEHAGQHTAGCFALSALNARRAQQELVQSAETLTQGEREELESRLEQSGVPSFAAHLEEQIIERAGRIKTLESARHLSDLLGQVASFRGELVAHYGALHEQLEALQAWLEEAAERRPTRVAQFERMEMEDGVEFMLRAMVNEIEEALHPSSSWVSRAMNLTTEDRDYLVTLIGERFTSLLHNSRDRVLHDVRGLEGEIAERMGPMLARLALQDARGLSQRLEAFQDEVSVLKLLLEERVYGRVSARARGQIDAASAKAFEAIVKSGDDAQRWRAMMRTLLPSLREGFEGEIEAWYVRFFAAATKLCERALGDVQLWRLEARYRYELEALEALVDPAPSRDA